MPMINARTQSILLGTLMAFIVCGSAGAPPKQDSQDAEPVTSSETPAGFCSRGGGFELRSEFAESPIGADNVALAGGRFTMIADMAPPDNTSDDDVPVIDGANESSDTQHD